MVPSLQASPKFVDGDVERYWDQIPQWREISTKDFNSYSWQLRETITKDYKLHRFLSQALPETIGSSKDILLQHIKTKEKFMEDALAAFKLAPMAIRLTPHILSRVDWSNPLDDPIRKQFIPLASSIIPDNDNLKLDSLEEEKDSPVPGLVHRYPGRALFLATSICPVYCRFCTRSYAIGAPTESVAKKPQKPSRGRWEKMFEYIESRPDLKDIVLSGGDAYYLLPEQLLEIGNRLLNMDNIRRIRIASKGLSVAPCRIKPGDPWTEALIAVAKKGRKMGKQVSLHTHINHAREITWATKAAMSYLFEHGVIVRNQSVLLKGVNDQPEDMMELLNKIADINITPYYVYQCDLVKGIEDLRTPLKVAMELEKKIRGTISGFNMPNFVVDLPGGGGKRLVSTAESYDETAGVAIYKTPGLTGIKSTTKYFYHDPKPMTNTEIIALRDQKMRQRKLERSQPVGEEATEAKSDCGYPTPKPAVKPNVERDERNSPDVQPGISYGWLPNGTQNHPPVSAYAFAPQ
ncbi:hypothetical protein DE146DRAFT_613297 [Phaeosphaeria sp. MPI-PUGE-AT-0046c]|nr:hypothetical protein DE146DRAFT_613297 [Phaeosphaeria sp. MPI-PUGE-AT-0046c]